MDPTTAQTVAENCKQALRTYFKSSRCGCAARHPALPVTLCELHAGEPVGQSMRDLLQQVEEDLTVLNRVATSLGAEDFQLKEIAGWFGDKLGRLKMAPLGHSINTFEALEFLSLGVLGKRAVWRALLLVRSDYPELINVDLAGTIARAESQYGPNPTLFWVYP